MPVGHALPQSKEPTTALLTCLQKKSSGFSLHGEQNRGVFLLRELAREEP